MIIFRTNSRAVVFKQKYFTSEVNNKLLQAHRDFYPYSVETIGPCDEYD